MNTRRQEESDSEMTLRLAERARESGVRIIRDRRDGRYYASSASCTGLWHYLTAVSCDCRGFISHGHCMHHSALLVALGWVTEDPEPEPTSPRQLIRCDTCDGTGEIHGTVSSGPTSWAYSWFTCYDCHGKGQFACPACMDTGIVEAYGEFCGQTQTPCSCAVGRSLTVVDLTIVKRSSVTPVERDAA